MKNFVSKNWYWLTPLVLALIAYFVFRHYVTGGAKTAGQTARQNVDAAKLPAHNAPTKKTVPLPPLAPRFPPGLDTIALLHVGVRNKKSEVEYLQNWIIGYNPFSAIVNNGVFDTRTGAELQKITGHTAIRLMDLPQ